MKSRTAGAILVAAIGAVAAAIACGEPIRNRIWWDRCGASCPSGVPRDAEPLTLDEYGYPAARGVCVCDSVWTPAADYTLDTCRTWCGRTFVAYFLVTESCVCSDPAAP